MVELFSLCFSDMCNAFCEVLDEGLEQVNIYNTSATTYHVSSQKCPSVILDWGRIPTSFRLITIAGMQCKVTSLLDKM